MGPQIHLFRCLEDNVGALIRDSESGACAAVDAPDEAAIVQALADTGWELTDCLVTHSHWDHVQGLEAIRHRFGCRVIAPASAGDVAEAADTIVREGDTVSVGEMAARIWETPGHCADHIVYHFYADDLLVAGDVLFVMGCGRVFGGDYDALYRALTRIKELPDATRIIVGHDYTLANARFAVKADPPQPRPRGAAARSGGAGGAQGPVRRHHPRRGEGDQSVPARRRACPCRSDRACRIAARGGIPGLARMEEQGIDACRTPSTASRARISSAIWI